MTAGAGGDRDARRQTWVVTGVRCRDGADYPTGPEARMDGTMAYLSLPDGSGGERSPGDVWLADPVIRRAAAGTEDDGPAARRVGFCAQCGGHESEGHDDHCPLRVIAARAAAGGADEPDEAPAAVLGRCGEFGRVDGWPAMCVAPKGCRQYMHEMKPMRPPAAALAATGPDRPPTAGEVLAHWSAGRRIEIWNLYDQRWVPETPTWQRDHADLIAAAAPSTPQPGLRLVPAPQGDAEGNER